MRVMAALALLASNFPTPFSRSSSPSVVFAAPAVPASGFRG